MKCLLVASAALFLLTGAAPPDAAPRYAVVDTVPGPDGSYDYTSVDEQTGRVYVGRRSGVMQFDPATREIKTLIAREGVASVLLIPGSRLMLTTNGRQNSATLLDRDSGAVVADIPTGKGPDGAAYDAASRLAFVMNGDSDSITLIDVPHAKVVGSIELGTVPEAAISDGAGHLYVNLEEAGAIAVVDIARRKVITRYRLAGCSEPTGLAFDPVSRLLVTVCHNGVAMAVEAKTGRVRSRFAIGKDADGSLFSPERRLGFVPCLDGTLTVYRMDGAGKVRVLQTLATLEGARTAAYDAVRDRLYLPAATVERDAKGDYVRARANFTVTIVGRELAAK